MPDALKSKEGRVTLIHVINGWLDTKRLKRAIAADTEHDLLFDAHLTIAAI
jgi:hypothetical protein